MATPTMFSLNPVNVAERPAPYPARYLKRHIYTDPAVFEPVDNHAINEARTNYRSFRDLIWNLFAKMNFNELEKARTIFRWLTTKNLYTIFFDSQMPGTPEHVIIGFKDGKTTYAKIFECLASFAGLHCVTLSGWVKGGDCKPGSAITSTPTNHSWNAVYIDGGWQLVDCHWATRYVQSDKTRRTNLIYEYDDFYFLPEPSTLIYSHCPQEVAWQLVNPVRSKSDFEIYPTVKSFFFSIGMQFLQQSNGVLYTKRGIVTITLGFTEPAVFTYKLGYGESVVETLQGSSLKRYVIQETIENRVTFYVRAPREGTYYLTIYAQRLTDGMRLENVFKAACEYKIVCDRTSAADLSPGLNPPESVKPFPLCVDHNWGPGYSVPDFGLVPSHRTALLAAPGGRAEVSFTRTRPVSLHAKLIRDGLSEFVLDKSVCVGEQDNQVFVTLRLPVLGEYGLEIYASEPARDGDTFTHISQHLVAYTDRDFGAVYGQVYDRSDLVYSGMQPSGGIYAVPSSRRGAQNYGSLSRGPQKELDRSGLLQDHGDNSVLLRKPRQGEDHGDNSVVLRKPRQTGRDAKQQHQSLKVKDPDRQSSRSISSKRPQSENLSQSKEVRNSITGEPWKNPLEVVYVTEIKDNIPVVRKRNEAIAEVPSNPVEVVYVNDVTKKDKKDQTSDKNSSDPRFPRQQYQEAERDVATKVSAVNSQAPDSFRPVPVADTNVVPEPASPEVPPKPFENSDVFADLDQHAVEVSKKEHRNFRDLVWNLIFLPDITDELEKARVIYLWLCSKDLTKMSFDNLQPGSPEEILMDLKWSNTTYAVVYEILCRYAGLHCKTISGYAKGAEYKPGMKFVGEVGQHSWNAVRVKGIWRLIDCHWSARRLIGKKIIPDNVRYELDEYYFMPNPHQIIFTHFPDDSRWQLLERPITLVEFETLVSVKSAFFKYGLQVVKHREAVIKANEEIVIRISCASAKVATLSFTFSLCFDNGDEDLDGVSLNNYGMHTMLDSVAYFTLRLPTRALYRFIVYAKDSDMQHGKEGVYGAVCEYAILCESSLVHTLPFPPCVHTSWGPGDSAARYGIVPLQKGSVFQTVNNVVEIRFKVGSDLRFTARLKAVGEDKGAPRILNDCVLCRVVGDTATFTVSVPEPGEFGLEIYANDPEIDGQSLYHAFQYLILCNEKMPADLTTDPLLPPGYLGPQPLFKKLGLQCASHDDPYIQTDLPELQITFLTANPVRMTSQLTQIAGEVDRECFDLVLQQCRGASSVAFHIRLPNPGKYKFQVYGQPTSDQSDNLPTVYNFLIEFTAPRRALTAPLVLPFPKQFGQWRDGCYLSEPLDGRIRLAKTTAGGLLTDSLLYFKVDIPRANAVAVVIGDDWFQLETRGRPQSSVWEGEINMAPFVGLESRLFVCANYGSVNASYHTMLEYSF